MRSHWGRQTARTLSKFSVVAGWPVSPLPRERGCRLGGVLVPARPPSRFCAGRSPSRPDGLRVPHCRRLGRHSCGDLTPGWAPPGPGRCRSLSVPETRRACPVHTSSHVNPFRVRDPQGCRVGAPGHQPMCGLASLAPRGTAGSLGQPAVPQEPVCGGGFGCPSLSSGPSAVGPACHGSGALGKVRASAQPCQLPDAGQPPGRLLARGRTPVPGSPRAPVCSRGGRGACASQPGPGPEGSAAAALPDRWGPRCGEHLASSCGTPFSANRVPVEGHSGAPRGRGEKAGFLLQTLVPATTHGLLARVPGGLTVGAQPSHWAYLSLAWLGWDPGGAGALGGGVFSLLRPQPQ